MDTYRGVLAQGDGDDIRELIFKLNHYLIVAKLDDGRLSILKEDEPLARCVWEQGDMAEAVATFQQLKTHLRTNNGTPGA